MSYFSTKIIKCVISRVLLFNVEFSGAELAPPPAGRQDTSLHRIL